MTDPFPVYLAAHWPEDMQLRLRFGICEATRIMRIRFEAWQRQERDVEAFEKWMTEKG